MTILFLTRRFYPDIGGVEKHVFEIGSRLVKSGHKVTVVTESEGREGLVKGIEIHRIRTEQNWLKKFRIWEWLWQNKNLITEADIVHAHDVYYWYFPFRFIYPFKKSFVTFHGYESFPIRRRAIFIRKISEKLSNGSIIVGEFIKKWYGTKPNYVIYGGANIPRSEVKPASRESAVFVGRLDKHTGVLEYAKTVDLIRKVYPGFEFKIYGDGEYKNKLKRYKPQGFVKNGQKYLKDGNFAFVSRYLSILEALSDKRLVFALYDNPVKEDYLKMTPFTNFIIIESSPEKLAERVKYYLSNFIEAGELVDKGFEWTKNQTWEKVIERYHSLWGLKNLK